MKETVLQTVNYPGAAIRPIISVHQRQRKRRTTRYFFSSAGQVTL